MARSISWNIYIIALIISVLIFSVGILIGMQVSQSATSSVQAQLEELQSQTREFELLSLLQATYPDSSDEFCEYYFSQIDAFGEQTANFGKRLDFLEKKRGRTDTDVQDLKKEYSKMQLRDFLLLKQANEKCKKSIKTILYFYTNDNCPLCTQQGYVLSSLKESRPEVMIYSFDTDLKAPPVEAMLGIFQIKHMPSVVVNGKTQDGFKTAQEISAALGD
ncbi:MAG: thioredoxin family protein [Candidatus Micrarchaeota archaeon]